MIVIQTACCGSSVATSHTHNRPYCMKCLQDDPPEEIIELCDYCKKPEVYCTCP